MTALVYVYDFGVIYMRTAIAVRNRKVREARKDVETGEDAAVVLNHDYVRLNLSNQFRIYLSLKHIYPVFRTKNLLLVLLEFLCYVSFGVDQSLLSDPLRRDDILESVADFEVISEDIVEAYLQGRYSRPFRLTLLEVEEIILSMS